MQHNVGNAFELANHRINVSMEIRHASDYDEFYIASEKETKLQIETAEMLLDLVIRYLNNKGIINNTNL